MRQADSNEFKWDFENPSRHYAALEYYGIVDDICKWKGWDDCVSVSQNALAAALNEIYVDIKALHLRRSPKKGISEAKIAGSAVFRLSRHSPISVFGALERDEMASKINHVAALSFGMKIILGMIELPGPNVMAEILFTLSRRHVNQETLGIVFDLILASKK